MTNYALKAFFLAISLLSITFAQQSLSSESFVKSFYTKYYPIYQASNQRYSAVLENLHSYFDESLYQQLQADTQRWKKNKSGEVCGFIDFDPFLNTQDLAGPVKKVKRAPNNEVAVTFSTGDTLRVALTKNTAGWKILNFIYLDHAGKKTGDLISVLKAREADQC